MPSSSSCLRTGCSIEASRSMVGSPRGAYLKAAAPAACLAAAGFASAASQVAAMREIGVAFDGSELVIGSVLGAWLLLCSLGMAAGSALSRAAGPDRLLFPLLAALGLVMPATLLATRLMPAVLARIPGEAAGFSVSVLASSAALAPQCAILGALFPAGLGALARAGAGSPAAAAYMAEAAGFLLGGAASTFVLIPFSSSSSAALVCSAATLASAAAWAASRSRWSAAAPAACLAAAAAACAFATGPADRWSRSFKHHGEEVLKTLDSKYGVFTVTGVAGQRNFYANGGLVWSSDNPSRAEEIVHSALCSHPNPEDVLIVGGGVRGALREALKHPVRKVTCVDLDPVPVREGMEFLGEADRAALGDPRARLEFADGRRLVKNSEPGSSDVILVDAPDPTTGRVNRYYTSEFFAEAARALRPGGRFCIGLSSAPGFAPDALRRLFTSVAVSLRSAFGSVMVLKADSAGWVFIASQAGPEPDAAELAGRFADRSISADFVGPRWFRTAAARPEGGALLAEALADSSAEPNTDLKPLCYLLHFSFSRLRFGSGAVQERATPGVLLALACAALAAALALLLRRASGRSAVRAAVFLSVFCAGAAAMVGKKSGRPGAVRRLAAALSGLAALSASAAALAGPACGLPGLWPAVLIASALAAFGAFLGVIYPLAVAAAGGPETESGPAAYASDTAGAAAGCAASSALLVPIAGMPGAVAASALPVAFCAAVLWAVYASRRAGPAA